MIVFRYLSRELLLTSGAVSAVLLVIIMSGRFIKYLAQAAEGRLDHTVLFLIMAYKLPSFFQLILPLGLFLSAGSGLFLLLIFFGRLLAGFVQFRIFGSFFVLRHNLEFTLLVKFQLLSDSGKFLSPISSWLRVFESLARVATTRL